ncbi:MAG: DDE-type integrase/transposase/recombinase, partial [Clostridia bacterium]|nr:DDE-type integrase/transposase/recombinase [Clostridia bacterium]
VTAADLATYKEAFGDEGIQKLADRQQAVMAVDGILNMDRGHMAAIEELAAKCGVTSRTLRRWHAAYKERGLAGIMDKVERKDKGKTKSMCRLAQDYIEAQMCDNRKFPQTLVLERLRERAAEYGDSACSCCVYCNDSNARRALKPAEREKFPLCDVAEGRMIVPANRHAVNRVVQTLDKAQLTYSRYGKRAWEAAYMQKTKRVKPTKVNEVWFGDHHKLDLFVLDENGSLVRPWMTAWMDACSRKFVGWELTLEPNSDTVADSFCRAAVYTQGSDVHGLPRYIYIDNGKDYRSQRFEGERFVNEDLGLLNAEFSEKEGLLRALGVGVHHALPYRGWSKDVERAFGTLEDFVREFPGWCGDSPEERPEDNGRILRRMKERGELMTFETFAKCFAEKLLPKYENHIGEDGLSPDERYHQAEKARSDTPDWATMAVFKSQCVKRMVSTQGVRLNNQLYWHPDMAEVIREQVTVYYNRGYNPSVTVFKGARFLCEAEPIELMALLEPDQGKVASHMADQKRQQKRVTERLAYLRQSTKRISREAYAEAIDEQRQRQATVTSLEAKRAEMAKEKVAARAAGRRKAASAGENAVRSMIAANGEALLKKSAR